MASQSAMKKYYLKTKNKIYDGSRKFETKSVMERENWKQKNKFTWFHGVCLGPWGEGAIR